MCGEVVISFRDGMCLVSKLKRRDVEAGRRDSSTRTMSCGKEDISLPLCLCILCNRRALIAFVTTFLLALSSVLLVFSYFHFSNGFLSFVRGRFGYSLLIDC